VDLSPSNAILIPLTAAIYDATNRVESLLLYEDDDNDESMRDVFQRLRIRRQQRQPRPKESALISPEDHTIFHGEIGDIPLLWMLLLVSDDICNEGDFTLSMGEPKYATFTIECLSFVLSQVQQNCKTKALSDEFYELDFIEYFVECSYGGHACVANGNRNELWLIPYNGGYWRMSIDWDWSVGYC
jgi:hypothetical protein